MAKVAKNLKKFRLAKNLTQDALAEKLYVTRQTVSGWENDRTQPDIEMLCKISEVLEVSVETLIYGERKIVTDEDRIQSRKKLLIIVFSVIASLLTGIGLILIFVTGWEKMPVALKGIFAFVPMLAGQAAAVYTFLRRSESVAWREGTSVLWCAGIAATVALVNSVFEVDSGFTNCLLADLMMFLPVIYIFDAVAPLTVCYSGTIFYAFRMFDTGEVIFSVVMVSLLYLAGLGYVLLNRKRKDDARHIFTVWLSVIALFFIILFNVPMFAGEVYIVIYCLMAFFTGLFIADKNDSWSLPFTPVGTLGIAAISVVGSVIYDPVNVYNSPDTVMFRWSLVFVSVIIAIGAVLGIKKLKNNIPNMICVIFAVVNMILQMVTYVLFERGNALMYIFILLSALGISVSLIASGIISGKFVSMNTGLVSFGAIIGYLIYRLVDIGFLAAGILLVVFGLVLFGVNFLLAKKTRNGKEEGT